jgi:hypothetical protein
MRICSHENNARLLFHLNTFSVIQITDFPAAPIWEIDTRILTAQHRTIGARFRIRWNAIWPEPNDTVEELRAASKNFIELIDGSNVDTSHGES